MVAVTLFGETAWQPTKDDCYTPAWIFDHMGVEFDLDVASPPGGVPWIPAKRYFTVHDDGLSQPWEGRVWCNPPFSSLTRWAERWIAHDTGAFLGPVAKSRWPHLVMNAAEAVWFPPGPVDWGKPDSPEPHRIAFLVFIAAKGAECVEGLRRLHDAVGGALLRSAT